jgi:DNA-binding response OmpR family regulator
MNVLQIDHKLSSTFSWWTSMNNNRPEKRIKVLLIDDEPSSLQAATPLFLEQGIEIESVTVVKEALEHIKCMRPDLILLDIHLPLVDGFTVCQRIREMPRCQDIPVIFISGSNEPKHLLKSLDVGGHDFMIKPFFVAELITRIKYHFRLAQKAEKAVKDSEQKAIATVVATYSHRINSPLSLALSCAKILQNEHGSEMTNKLAQALDELTGIMNEIRNITRGSLYSKEIYSNETSKYLKIDEKIDENNPMISYAIAIRQRDYAMRCLARAHHEIEQLKTTIASLKTRAG